MGISVVSVIGKIHLKIANMNTLTMPRTLMFIIIYVTKSDKAGLIALFCISRNTDLKYWMHCTSLVMQHSHTRYIV